MAPQLAVDVARAEAIPGWMSRAELVWLAEHARACRLIVEVGCWQGRSTRALADHCAGTVVAVDPWSGTYYADDGRVHTINTDVYAQFARHLADHLASGRVVSYERQFTDAASTIARRYGQVDLVFIDGDHRYAQVHADIDAALGLVRDGGVLAGHDYGHRDWPGVARAVHERFPLAARCDSIWWVTR